MEAQQALWNQNKKKIRCSLESCCGFVFCLSNTHSSAVIFTLHERTRCVFAYEKSRRLIEWRTDAGHLNDWWTPTDTETCACTSLLTYSSSSPCMNGGRPGPIQATVSNEKWQLPSPREPSRFVRVQILFVPPTTTLSVLTSSSYESNEHCSLSGKCAANIVKFENCNLPARRDGV